MECTVQNNGTSLILTVNNSSETQSGIIEKKSEKYTISDAIVIQLKHVIMRTSNNGYSYSGRVDKYYDFVSFEKLDKSDTSSYSVKLKCTEFGINKIFEVDNNSWRMINDSSEQKKTYTLSIRIAMITQLNPFAKLYDDLNLTDFTLKCDDGSIEIHKAVLAAASTYFKAKIIDVNENELPVTSMVIPNTNKNTLEDFKRALYMDVLPKNNLEQLLLLATYFKLKILEYKCVDKILNKLKPNAVGDLLTFALKYNNVTILLGILDQVQSGQLKVGEIRKHYLTEK